MKTKNPLLDNTSGSMSNFTCRQINGMTVVSEKSKPHDTRSRAAMLHRLKWVNTMAMYRQINQLLADFFEDCTSKRKRSNLYAKLNLSRTPMYLTKEESRSGQCILVPHQISLGTLPPVDQQLDDSNRLCSKIRLQGSIDAGTTIADFANDLLPRNPDFRNGDTLNLLMLRQKCTGDGLSNYVEGRLRSLPIDIHCSKPLSDFVDPALLCVRDGYLGLAEPLDQEAASFVHTRRKGEKISVSSQILLCVNEMLTNKYSSDEQFLKAVESYGGFNEKVNGLSPKTEPKKCMVVVESSDTRLGLVGKISDAYPEGTRIVLTASPLGDARFVGWFNLQNHLVSNETSCPVVISDNCAFVARFEE